MSADSFFCTAVYALDGDGDGVDSYFDCDDLIACRCCSVGITLMQMAMATGLRHPQELRLAGVPVTPRQYDCDDADPSALVLHTTSQQQPYA